VVPENQSKHPSRLDLGDQLLGGSSADSIRHRIERGKIAIALSSSVATS
jgi:hypothetical protein